MQGRAEDESIQALRLEFQNLVAERAGVACPTVGGVDGKWVAVREPLLSQLMSWWAR